MVSPISHSPLFPRFHLLFASREFLSSPFHSMKLPSICHPIGRLFPSFESTHSPRFSSTPVFPPHFPPFFASPLCEANSTAFLAAKLPHFLPWFPRFFPHSLQEPQEPRLFYWLKTAEWAASSPFSPSFRAFSSIHCTARQGSNLIGYLRLIFDLDQLIAKLVLATLRLHAEFAQLFL